MVQVSGHRNSFTLTAGSRFAGTSDAGHKHLLNQDALALAVAETLQGDAAIIAVSDGVSSSEFSDRAAAVAANSACRQLAASSTGVLPHTERFTAAMVEAFLGAQDKVVSGAGGNPGGSWACTLLCAVAFGSQVVVGNVGDSRCYWVPDDADNALLFSRDDSIAEEHIQRGIRRGIAEAARSAHAITKWLGPGAHNVIPSVQVHTIDRPGWLLVCSDGLWNYASQPAQLAAALRAVTPRHAKAIANAPQLASRLVEWACARGGRDNITVALLRTPYSDYTR
jgi:serine/threonine protein phosphatase PrpC